MQHPVSFISSRANLGSKKASHDPIHRNDSVSLALANLHWSIQHRWPQILEPHHIYQIAQIILEPSHMIIAPSLTHDYIFFFRFEFCSSGLLYPKLRRLWSLPCLIDRPYHFGDAKIYSSQLVFIQQHLILIKPQELYVMPKEESFCTTFQFSCSYWHHSWYQPFFFLIYLVYQSA